MNVTSTVLTLVCDYYQRQKNSRLLKDTRMTERKILNFKPVSRGTDSKRSGTKLKKIFAAENSFSPSFSHIIVAICGFGGFSVHICL